MTAPTVLLTLGRLPKALDLARGFAAAGCRVIVAEPFRRHLAGASRAVERSIVVPPPSAGKTAYLDALTAVIEREGVDLVVPVSEETMHVAFLKARQPGVAVFTMPPEAVIPLHDKAGFIRQARRCGLDAPETHRLGSAEAERMAAARDVIVKPVFSCAGRGVAIVRRGQALPDAQAAAVVQAFTPGQEHSTCTLARDGRALSTVVYRGTIMSGTVACAFERVEHPAIEAWVARFVAAVRWTGFIAFDIIVDADGQPHGIECNPRSTSGVHFWEPLDVARAVLGETGAIRFRPERTLQQFYSCLTEAQKAIGRPGFGARLAALWRTRDATWDRRDPAPFLTMTFTSWRIIRMALARRTTFGEVATLDVGWYEDAPE
jgi:predicted ATP-grasp superfamily ATP-dependent carboligase